MFNPNIPLRDQVTARALSAGSGLLQLMPSIRDRIGGADVDAYTPVRWRYNGMAVKNVSNWVEIEGNPEHGNTPKNYRETAILAVDSEELNGLEEFARPSRPAVAYACGKAVVVGIFPEGRDFNRTVREAAVGMRIGKGELRASVGIWRPSTQAYIPASTVRVRDRIETDRVSGLIPLV